MSEVVLFQELSCDNGKKIAVATLNAERSLNALSGRMIDLLVPQLQSWQSDEQVAAVILQGAGEKAFCAGGDIVTLYQAMASEPGEYAPAIEAYFSKEYQLDYLIHRFEKPVLVWGSGIVLGGGLGIMVGASHKVVTETSRIAMPEISIGLFPDVGGSWFLNRMPGQAGLFLGLTGAAINAGDAKYVGLADYFVLGDKKQQLIESLQRVNWGNTIALNHEKLSNAILEMELLSSGQLPLSQIRAHQTLINEVTGSDQVTHIVDAILAVDIDDKWFNKAQKTLKHGSAISAHIVHQQLKRGKSLSLADCFRIELNLAVKCGQFGEFMEGVRALLIDKDQRPQWKFNTIHDVDPSVIEWFFADKWQDDQHPLAGLGS